MTPILHIVIPKAGDALDTILKRRLSGPNLEEAEVYGLCSRGGAWQSIGEGTDFSGIRIALLKPTKAIVLKLLATAAGQLNGKSEGCVWWHPDSSMSSSELWNRKMLQSEFVAKFGKLSFECFPFSLESSYKTSWDTAIAHLLVRGGLGSHPDSSDLADLDLASGLARSHFLGFQQVKAILKDLFPAFVVLKEIEAHEGTAPNNLLAAGTEKLAEMAAVLRATYKAGEVNPTEWLDVLYSEHVTLPLAAGKNYPVQTSIAETLKRLNDLVAGAGANEPAGKQALPKEDLLSISLADLKQLFRLLNAYPTVTQ